MSAMPETVSLSILARQYVAAGWALVPIPSGSKGPHGSGWNKREHCVTTPDDCRRIKANVGLAHAYSGTCVIDLDDFAGARTWLQSKGIDLEDLWSSIDAIKISSGRPNRGKLLYRLPAGARPLPSKKVGGGVLELRCAASNGTSVQDVLPPSIHPETGAPYEWDFDPIAGAHWSNPPELPPEVFDLWVSLVREPEHKEPVAAAERERPPRSEKDPLGLGRNEIRKLIYQEDPSCDYDTWLGIGFALHHEMRGAALGLELWDEWSSEGNNYPGWELLEQKWKSFGKGYSGPEKTVRSLMEKHGVSTEDDFEDLDEPEEQEAVRAEKFAVCSAGEFGAGPPQQWIVKGMLPRAQIGMVYGESTAGKSFVVLDMLAAIARGVDWRGMRTKQLRTVLVVAEGAGGARGRIRAYEEHHGVDLSEHPFGIIQDRPDLFGHDDKRLAAQIKAWGGADVIAVDTLAQSSAGANENSGEDMGKVLSHCLRLHEATGAMVLLVHHAGKDVGRGARGWSGLKAAMDVEIEVARSNLTGRTIRLSKSKDGEDGKALGFKLNVVQIGVDEDGDPITSCVVEHGAGAVVSVDAKDGLKDAHRAVLKALTDASDLVDSLHYEALKQAALAILPASGRPDNDRRAVVRAIEHLQTKGYIEKVEEGNLRLITRDNV